MGCGKGDGTPAIDEREAVREHYSETAKSVEGGCCCSNASVYDSRKLEGIPLDAILASRGCADPHSFAGIKAGESVLDLGCGGGIDCLIAARQVGEGGRVVGLDMTDEMLELAERNRKEAGACNVEFVKGYLEDIPLPDDCMDVVISNCVINLCPDKRPVFSEASRVLHAGGRFAVADIVMLREVSAETAERMRRFLGSGSVILTVEGYRSMLAEAGFGEVDIVVQTVYDEGFMKARAVRKGYEDQLAEMDVAEAAGAFAGAMVVARKRAERDEARDG